MIFIKKDDETLTHKKVDFLFKMNITILSGTDLIDQIEH